MKKLFYLFTLILISQNLSAERITVAEYLEKFKDFSISEMYRTGIPASIKLGQGILESDIGNSKLSKNSNNHFGIKCKSTWTGKTYYHEDDDFDNAGKLLESCFRAYISPYESYLDHSEFLANRERYKFLFAYHHTDYKQWAYGLKSAGYATAKGYSETLIRIIEKYNLSQYDSMANPYEVKPLALSHTFDENEKLAVLGRESETITEIASRSTVKIEHAEKGYEPFKIMRKEDNVRLFFPEEGKDYFQINNLMAVSSKNQTLLQIAKKNEIKLKRLLKYNEISIANDLIENQYIFLSKKEKSFIGFKKAHTVQKGENMYIIAQRYGIRLKYLYKMNKMKKGQQPATGQVLILIGKVNKAPKLS
ncbi:MAG: hypothetical protein ACJA1N_000553 [Saprospiraceae bacterium]|jgi:hypothetical protein